MPPTDLTIPGESAAVIAVGRGIGRQMARRLVATGVDVAVDDVDEDALAEASAALADCDGDVVTVAGDASDPRGHGDVRRGGGRRSAGSTSWRTPSASPVRRNSVPGYPTRNSCRRSK